MDINQARFIFEVQRVSDRVAAECQYAPLPAPRSSEPRPPVRHILALWLHHLAARVDVPAPFPA